jgi:hypothetical protein
MSNDTGVSKLAKAYEFARSQHARASEHRKGEREADDFDQYDKTG